MNTNFSHAFGVKVIFVEKPEQNLWAVHCLYPTPRDYPAISLQKYWHGWSSLPESAEYQ